MNGCIATGFRDADSLNSDSGNAKTCITLMQKVAVLL
jgi:hypothetical protein